MWPTFVPVKKAKEAWPMSSPGEGGERGVAYMAISPSQEAEGGVANYS